MTALQRRLERLEHQAAPAGETWLIRHRIVPEGDHLTAEINRNAETRKVIIVVNGRSRFHGIASA
jgi:hypothetical protein